MKQARWLVLAAVLLGLGAWLTSGKTKPTPKPVSRSFPTSQRSEEYQRMEARRTFVLPPVASAVASASAGPEAAPAPRDPLLVAFAAPADVAMVVEARALLDTPVAGLLLDCLSDQEKERFDRKMAEHGLDWRQAIERVALFKEEGQDREVMAFQGKFASVDWKKIAPRAEVRAVGPHGRLLSEPGSTREVVGVWREELVLVGQAEAVERAMKRLSGELPPGKPPLTESETYGEIYGVVGGEALAKLAPPEMEEKMRKALSRMELHVDALDDILLVMDGTGHQDEHGHGSQEVVELAKSMAAAVAVARVKARADGDEALVDLLDRSRVRPFQGGMRAEVAVPLETVKKHLKGCKKGK
jgi:hypothetical protein